MDYENMSDFEINKRAAEACDLLIQEMDDSSKLGMTTEFHEKYPSVVWVAHLDCSTGQQCEPWWQFDPCNNPTDAWPLIEQVWSTLMSVTSYDYGVGVGESKTTIWDARMHMYGDNKLRAACIVYLMIQEKGL